MAKVTHCTSRPHLFEKTDHEPVCSSYVLLVAGRVWGLSGLVVRTSSFVLLSTLCLSTISMPTHPRPTDSGGFCLDDKPNLEQKKLG